MAHTHRKLGSTWLSLPIILRVSIAAVLGILSALYTGYHLSWTYAPLAFWDITAGIAGTALWFSLRHLNATDTKKHATRDDPGQGVIDVLMLCASLASLAAVFSLLLQAHSAEGLSKVLDITFGVASVVISWTLVQLIYTLRYADLYFKQGEKSIDFNESAAPTYQDFAYLAFTIGMTYQVSDTSIGSATIRKTIRQHALISYIFGTAIIATAINTLAGLATK